MLSCVTEIALFFKYFPKTLHVLPVNILEYNIMKNIDKRINSVNINLFCTTKWVDRHLVIEGIIGLYQPLQTTL